jgi:hypothetical protein
MKKSIIIIFAISVFFACKQENKSTPENAKIETVGSTKIVQLDKDIYSKYEYTDSQNKSIIIKNGYPKGGIKYTDTNRNEKSYATFLTQIINETDNQLEINIDLPINSYEILNFPGKYFKILVPAEIMTIDKFPSQTDLQTFIDYNIYKPSLFKRVIKPKESSGLYFVMLISTLEATGMTRTELNIKGQELYYKLSRYSITKPTKIIDEKEIHCGSINLKNLTLKN